MRFSLDANCPDTYFKVSDNSGAGGYDASDSPGIYLYQSPEPASLALLGAGAVAMIAMMRRRKKTRALTSK